MKKMKTFNCPVCGNELRCTDNKTIRCHWCNQIIIPEGFRTKQRASEYYKRIENYER